MFGKRKIYSLFNRQLKTKNHLLGVACGSGAMAQYAAKGGADFILGLNSGKYRQMGRSSLAGYLSYANSNDMTFEFVTKEIVTIIDSIPIIFGLFATDPTKDMSEYLKSIKHSGISGINNYPSISLIDGGMNDILEESGISYQSEVDAIKLANEMDMFTIAFVTNTAHAELMLNAGADMICAHLGLTRGGLLGAKKVLSLESSAKLARDIFNVCDVINPDIYKIIYGGAVSTPTDLEYMYSATSTMGYIGGSSFERIPSESFLTELTMQFKSIGRSESDKLLHNMLDGVQNHFRYIDFIKKYIAENYMYDIAFCDLAKVVHISRPYLSTLFNREIGESFSKYLNRYRIKKACELMRQRSMTLREISEKVGYHDYAHFSRVFKEFSGISPKYYLKDEPYQKNTRRI